MSNFKIPVIPRTSQKTIRFPNEVIERVEEKIKGIDSSFSTFVVEATKKALDDLDNN